MARRKQYYVFSVFSNVLQDYPYFPFVAKSINEGISKFIRFIDRRDSICEGAELHVIGTCDYCGKDFPLENICPYMFPQRVEFKNKLTATLFTLSSFYTLKVTDYLSNLFDCISTKLRRRKDV